MTPRIAETAAFAPAFGRTCALSFAFAFFVGGVILLLVKMPPVVEVILLVTLAVALAMRLQLRLTLTRFDEAENGPWFIRATTTWFGLSIASRVAARRNIEITNKYREYVTESSGCSEKYWQEVELSDGTSFFTRWEVFLFGHKRLVQAMEDFL